MSVFGSDEQSAVAIDLTRWLDLARLVLREERAPSDAEVSLIFVDEESIGDLNERFLGGTGPTDVLSFPIDDPPPSGRHPDQGGRGPGAPSRSSDPPLVLGDVVLCPTVAARQAVEHGVGIDDELALLIVHGILHLLQYDHAEPADETRMKTREQALLARFRETDDRA
jgi:probable rRNA maturation factor